ncbi:MAG: phytoene/squalene synthase family protein [Gammaproteobacteria bacterium]|nr:phytoene/squalene synthase family protein [Gammaproteobacteria bacterium]
MGVHDSAVTQAAAGVSASTADLAFQNQSLQGVSRTFALTIPQLPAGLRDVVGNAYLLCRLADTIEDDAQLDAQTKREFAQRFISVVDGTEDPAQFARELAPRLAPVTPVAERELVEQCAVVLRITRTFNAAQQASLQRCVRIMAGGMADFQEGSTADGLDTLRSMDRYCYYVAGVVGEMLTELFCDYSPKIAERREEMMPLSISFGQGLQMTNILKDVWDDFERGACWLPRDVFARAGASLHRRPTAADEESYKSALRYLIGVAHAHLNNALTYTLLLPKEELGIRRFCLWALGMAVLTLKKIHGSPQFSDAAAVKISRRAVKGTVAVTSLSAGSDWMLRRLFDLASSGLPLEPVELLSGPALRAGSGAVQ